MKKGRALREYAQPHSIIRWLSIVSPVCAVKPRRTGISVFFSVACPAYLQAPADLACSGEPNRTAPRTGGDEGSAVRSDFGLAWLAMIAISPSPRKRL